MNILKNMINKLKILTLSILVLSACTNVTPDSSIKVTQNNNLINMYTGDQIELDNDLYVVNIWASWCLECIQEHQVFVELSKYDSLENKIIFVLFQDDAKKATEFVEKYGAGNIIFGLDPDSRLAIDLGVFGVPETYIIKDLEVKKKFIGPANLLSILTEVNNISK